MERLSWILQVDQCHHMSLFKWKEAEEKGPERWQRLDKQLLAQKMEEGYEPKNDGSLWKLEKRKKLILP